MLVQGIKSRPVYGGIGCDAAARRHLFALEGAGAAALLEQSLPAAELAKADVLYVPASAADKEYAEALAALGADTFWTAPTIAVLLNRLNVMLTQARMGARIYLAGTEGFIGQALQVALAHGLDHASVRTEHRGSKARRVQCVHCKGITEDVRTSPVACAHCGLRLLVRDHYSRRLGAFQGVCIDAEEPGSAPAPEELFP
jgi:dimethylamine monooxygenase subunit C